MKEEVNRIDEARNDALVLPASVGIDDIRMFPGEDGIWTHIVDVDAAETIGLFPGITGADVQFFLDGLKSVSDVSSYSSDGADQYIAVGKANLPTAVRTLNPFHVIKYLFKGLDAVRCLGNQHHVVLPFDGSGNAIQDERVIICTKHSDRCIHHQRTSFAFRNYWRRQGCRLCRMNWGSSVIDCLRLPESIALWCLRHPSRECCSLNAETLIKNADTAMYQAKENGHDGYESDSNEAVAKEKR